MPSWYNENNIQLQAGLELETALQANIVDNFRVHLRSGGYQRDNGCYKRKFVCVIVATYFFFWLPLCFLRSGQSLLYSVYVRAYFYA